MQMQQDILGVDHLIFDGGGGGRGCANPPKKYRAQVSGYSCRILKKEKKIGQP